jgi:hypothetical protein
MAIFSRILRGWLLMALACAALSGCSDDKKNAADAGGGSKNDSGTSMTGGKCGTATCTVSDLDKMWGAEACCVDEAKGTCGVKADHPVVPGPDGGVIPVGSALAMLAALRADAGVVNNMPTIPCLPKNAPGAPNAKCPSETFNLSAAVDAGGEDAGAPALYVIKGCCRPDGMCGYVDDNAGLGCVKISQSLLGQVLGRKDQSCN